MRPKFYLTAATVMLATSVAFAQPARMPAQQAPIQVTGGQNLQVLPPGIARRALNNLMQGYSAALGVSCSHCHVPGNFASDDNPNKNIARAMMRMTATINERTLPAIAGLGPTRVSCATCHRGAAVPSLGAQPAPPSALPKQ